MKTYPESRLTDLLIEFDEMGFALTTVCPNAEQTAIEWKEQIVKEIQKLQAENSELRATLSKMETVEARLEKAVELPRIIHPNANEWFVQYQNEYGLFFDEIFYSERDAEARLKEIKENNNG